MKGPLVYRTDLQFSLLRERTKRRVNVPEEFSHTNIHVNTRCWMALMG